MSQDIKRLLGYLRRHGRRLFFSQGFFHPGRDRGAALGSTPGVLDQFSIKSGFLINSNCSGLPPLVRQGVWVVTINKGAKQQFYLLTWLGGIEMRTAQMRATGKILLGVLTAIAVVLPATASAQVIWEADA